MVVLISWPVIEHNVPVGAIEFIRIMSKLVRTDLYWTSVCVIETVMITTIFHADIYFTHQL